MVADKGKRAADCQMLQTQRLRKNQKTDADKKTTTNATGKNTATEKCCNHRNNAGAKIYKPRKEMQERNAANSHNKTEVCQTTMVAGL